MGIFDLFKPKPNVEEMEKNGDILGLIKILKRRSSDDLRKRSDVERRAISALGRIGEPAVEPLIQALKEGVKLAPVALGTIGKPAVMPLIWALDCQNEAVRAAVVVALATIGEQAREDLIWAQRIQNPWIPDGAAAALEMIGKYRLEL